ncbi:MAG: threonylcarbamoyl-AMP synthase [Clostridia bacterium]|nr:threonylcarbamoyl-AMP synthase [Clostridia bacterium]
MEQNIYTKIVYAPTEDDLKNAADLLRRGGLVAIPTETVYGLGVNALLADAAPKVYAAKGRPSDNPLIIHLAASDEAEKYAVTCNAYYKLASAFMPGPLTVILPKRECIPDSVTGGLATVAVRVPSHPIAHRLIELCGFPIAAPSANLSGRPSTTTVEHVIEDMNGRVDMILNGGASDIGLESTIVLPKEDGSLVLLRPGAITVEMLEEEGFTVTLDKAVTERLQEGERPLAPGMKYRHYAPHARVILLSGEREAVQAAMEPYRDRTDVALVCYADDPVADASNARVLGAFDRRDEQARNLFDLLRSFDSSPEITRIYATLPDRKEIGLALFNRMLKAAGYDIEEV